MIKKECIVFVDGSSLGNPGPGGWGSIIVSEGKVFEMGGREEKTTNNRMELTAAIEGLKQLRGIKIPTIVYSDSSYIINGITKWVFGWKKNGWKTKEGKEVLNRDLWEKLFEFSIDLPLEWVHVAGHSDTAGNNRADEIARGYAEGKPPKLYRGAFSQYEVKNIEKVSVDASKKIQTSQKKDGKAFSYLSLVEGVLERHTTWKECEERVRGLRGARFRKALSKEDEGRILKDWDLN